MLNLTEREVKQEKSRQALLPVGHASKNPQVLLHSFFAYLDGRFLGTLMSLVDDLMAFKAAGVLKSQA